MAFVVYRTQVHPTTDNVKKIQAGYKVEPLSAFLGQAAPPAAPAIDFMKPLTPDEEKNSLKFFDVLNFVLQFCPVNPAETELRARFAKIGIGRGKRFSRGAFAGDARGDRGGIADAWERSRVQDRRKSTPEKDERRLLRYARIP